MLLETQQSWEAEAKFLSVAEFSAEERQRRGEGVREGPERSRGMFIPVDQEAQGNWEAPGLEQGKGDVFSCCV